MKIGTILDQIDLGSMALPEFQRAAQSGVHGSAKRRSLPPTWTPPMVPCLRFRDSGNPCCSGFGRTHAAPSFGGSDVRSGSRTEASDREAEARQRFGDSSGGGHVAVPQTSESPLSAHG